jgi:CHAD domain-containing protein
MAPARPIRNLDCEESFRTAAGKVIWTRFEEMMSFRDEALAGEDIEGVHDMRVGSRRLRAALELFRDVFPSNRLSPLLRDVKSLADSLGDVRDMDVMIDRLKRDMKGRPPSQQLVLGDMIADLNERRDQAREVLKETISRLEREEFPRQFLAVVAQETM